MATTAPPTPSGDAARAGAARRHRSDRGGAAVAHRRRVGAGAHRPPQRRRLPDAGAGFGREHASGVLDEVANRLSFIQRVPDERRDADRGSRRSCARCCGRCSTSSASPARAVRERRSARAARRGRRRARHDRATIRTSSPGRAARSIASLAGEHRRSSRPGGRGRQDGGDARRRGAVRRAGRGRRARDAIRTSTTATSTRSASFRDPALVDRGLQLRAVAAAAQPGHGDLPRAVLRQPRRARARVGVRQRATGRRSSRRSPSSAATPS